MISLEDAAAVIAAVTDNTHVYYVIIYVNLQVYGTRDIIVMEFSGQEVIYGGFDTNDAAVLADERTV